jgi:hypothetical protein
MLASAYLAQKLTPYRLPTKDGGVLRTIGDARAYMLALPKREEPKFFHCALAQKIGITLAGLGKFR